MHDSNSSRPNKTARPIIIKMPRMPRFIERRIERKLERRCLAQDACDALPEVDRERLRIESDSARIIRLQSAYTRAKRDAKLRLVESSPPEDGFDDGEEEPVSIWEFFAGLYAIVQDPNDMSAWVSMLIYNRKIRARGKGEETCPELKAMLDCMTDEGLLCYEKRKRVYSLAPCYAKAVRLMRNVELSLLNQLLPKRQIRQR